MKNYGLDENKLQSFNAIKSILNTMLSEYDFDWYFTQNKIRPHENFIVRLNDVDNRLIIIQAESNLTPRIRIIKSGFNIETGLSEQPDQHWLNVPVRSGVLKKAHEYIDNLLSMNEE